MPDTLVQITAEELKKMLAESFLSDELKTAYGEVLNKMNDEEKNELIKIIEEGNKAKEEHEARTGGEAKKLEQLARLNKALAKHLAETLRDEKKYIREQFETFDNKSDETEMNNLEQEINNL